MRLRALDHKYTLSAAWELSTLTHQFIHQLLLVCSLLLRILQVVLPVQELLLQVSDLAQTTVPSCLVSSPSCISAEEKLSVHLSVCPGLVGSGGLVFVPEKRLQLGNSAV